MGMRITTSMMMNSYRFNLQNSTGKLNDSRNKVLSQRKFESYAEDPAAATQAWRIRRAMAANFDYQANNADTNSRFNIAWTTMGVVNYDLADLDGRFSSIRGENGAIGAGRQPLGKVLSESAETIIQSMNSAKYGDHYVFSGDDELNPPFTWNEDRTILYYRGVNVGAGAVKRPTTPDWVQQLEAGKEVDIPPEGTGKNEWEEAWIQYYTHKSDVPDWAKNELVDGKPVNMPESSEDQDEQEWIKYYNDVFADPDNPDFTVEKPTSEPPAWAMKSYLVNGKPATMPEKSNDENEQAWIDYYNDLFADPTRTDLQPPEVDEEHPKPEWANYDGMIGGIPQGMLDVNRDDLTSDWEKGWYDYYLDQALEEPTGVQAPEYYAKPEEVPAWTTGAAARPEHLNAWDEAWEDYLKDPENGTKPSLDPLNGGPTSVNWGEPDAFGVPANAWKIARGEVKAASDSDVAWAKYYIDQGDVKKLELLANERQYVDLGMGLAETTGGTGLPKVISGTAFDRSLPGIEMLGGYGVDEDGDPRNVVLIMKRLGELFTASNPNTGEWGKPGDEVEAMRLMDKLTAAHSRITENYSEVDTRGQFLQNNQTRLEDQGFYLQEERLNLEAEDPANAISEFMWDYTCYNAALKIGTQLLSQSLIDYMG